MLYFYLTGKWCEKVYKITLSEYKAVMKNWFSGTGGGSGDATMFVHWDQEKLNKYDINPTLYDHSNIKNRPSILIDNYTNRKKYLTVIFLLDETKDYILGSKYDPVTIGLGEAGMQRNSSDGSLSGITNSSESVSKAATRRNKIEKKAEENASNMMKSVIHLMYSKEKELKSNGGDESVENLMKLYDMYMNNLKYYKERGTLTDEREKSILAKIDTLFDKIEERTVGQKRQHEDITNDSSVVS